LWLFRKSSCERHKEKKVCDIVPIQKGSLLSDPSSSVQHRID
jgi:hypothetical protein